MSESFERQWSFYIDDMIEFCGKALVYTDGFDQERFVESGLTYDATVHNISLVGEAATHIPDHVRQQAPNIQWRLIIGTRNRLIHGYLGIDNDTLWSIIETEIPQLLDDLLELKKRMNGGAGQAAP